MITLFYLKKSQRIDNEKWRNSEEPAESLLRKEIGVQLAEEECEKQVIVIVIVFIYQNQKTYIETIYTGKYTSLNIKHELSIENSFSCSF